MYDGAKGNDVLAADLAVLTPGKAHATALLDGLTTGTASKLEEQAVRLVRKAVSGLPVSVQVNGLIGQHRFDIVIPDPRGFIRDRWKANAAAQWGWLVLRYTDFCIGPGGVDSRIVAQVRDIVARRANRRWSGIPHYRDPGVWTFHPQLI